MNKLVVDNSLYCKQAHGAMPSEGKEQTIGCKFLLLDLPLRLVKILSYRQLCLDIPAQSTYNRFDSLSPSY